MAVTKTTYTQSGSTTQYAVPFEVIAAADIDVYVDGVLQLQQNTTSNAAADHPQVVTGEITQGTALINYTVASNNATITFNTAPTAGAFIVVERTTDDTLLETFVSGSTIRAADLNNALERVLFIAQEGVNIAGESLGASETEDDTFDAGGYVISGVGNAQDDDDAVNRGQLGKVITDDLIAGEGIDLTDTTGGTNSGKQVTVSAELSTATNPGVVQVTATSPLTATYSSPGDLELSIQNGSIDIGKIDEDDIITYAEQQAGTPAWTDTRLATASASALRFDTIVQTTTPSGSSWETGKTWLQNDADLTLSIWNGSAWTGITSGGTFLNQPKVVYVDASSGNDANDGHRISRPKASIKAAVEQINADSTYGDGSVVVVAPGVYQEAAPIDIEKKDVSIIGQAIRSCIVHPTVATQYNSLFRLNSGSYIANLTLTGMKATGTRGEVGSDYENATYGLPATQGWNFSFYPGAVINKSPYIQNCTNFSDSEIDNSDLNAHSPAGGAGGDTDSAMTGGGLLVDGSVVSSSSPLRSMVCDSYTHVGLDGPGVLVTNNGYCQATSSYAFFNHFHIACIRGGQANLAASTTDFGRYSLVTDGKSPNAIFTATTTANAADLDTTFTIGTPSAGSDWFGSATRPQSNMLVTIGGNTYPVLDATPSGSGWTVTISRPNPSNKAENLGLNGAVSSGASVEFFLRSMIASSGHTMEYVGSGTNYSALPENGGVPDDTAQVVELNDGKVWTAITDHNGKFTVGPFEVDQRTGAVTIEAGSTVTNIVDDPSPQLGGDLDANGNDIILSSGSATEPSLTFTGDSNTGLYSPAADEVDITVGGTAQLEVTSTGISTPGNITTTAGDITVTSGNATLSSGNLSVTGTATVTSDLTVDSGALFVDASENHVGINEASPLTELHVSGDGSEIFLEETGAGAITGAEIACITKITDEFNIQTRTSAGVFVSNDYQILSNSSGATQHTFNIGGVEHLHIDANGMELKSGERFIIKDNLTGLTLDKTASTNYTGIAWTESDTLGYMLFLENTADSDLKLQCRVNDVFTATAFQIPKATGRIEFPSDIRLPDNKLIYFGSGTDGVMFHSGSHQYLDLYTGNFYIRDGTTTRYTFDDSGYFRATGKVEGTELVASSSANNAFIGNFNNYAGTTTAYGLNVRAGSTSGTLVVWKNGSNVQTGSIYFSGGTVTYGAFTAHHPCILPSADSANAYPYGTLLEIVEVLEDLENSEGEVTHSGIYYRVQKSQSSHSRKLLGAYGSRLEDPDAPADGNWHTAYVLGDGHVLVNNSGGNIEVGDGIAASATAGIGQKATETPSMIIGIAQEAVTFANDTEEKLVAVQYGVQQFTPWS